MGEKILSWFERIVTGEKRRWFFAAVIVAIILGVIVFPYIDANFLYYLWFIGTILNGSVISSSGSISKLIAKQ